MTDQTKLALAGLAAAAVTKFYFQKDWMMSALVGMSVLATYAILTANTKDQPA